MDAISRAYVDSWKSTYQGIMPEIFIKGMTQAAAVKIFNDSLQPNEYSYFLHVAETPEGRIIGFADGGKERSHPEQGIGELYAIYLLKEFQRQGAGKLLLKASVQSLLQAGMESMVVWVVEKSPYQQFYWKHGGVKMPRMKQLEAGGERIRLVCYSWEDLKTSGLSSLV